MSKKPYDPRIGSAPFPCNCPNPKTGGLCASCTKHALQKKLKIN